MGKDESLATIWEIPDHLWGQIHPGDLGPVSTRATPGRFRPTRLNAETPLAVAGGVLVLGIIYNLEADPGEHRSGAPGRHPEPVLGQRVLARNPVDVQVAAFG